MNLWVVLGVLLLGAALALGPGVLSWLDPQSPARAAGRLLEVVSSWNAVRDATARLIVRGPEGETRVHVRFLVPASIRVALEEPQPLAGEVFALRPVGEEWLLIHHRPNLDLGVEVRLPAEKLSEWIQGPTPAELAAALRRGAIRVTHTPGPEADLFDIQGLPGTFPRAKLAVDRATLLPWKLELYRDVRAPPALEVEVAEGPGGREIAVNRGLELRDLFLLDPYPTRWLAAPER